MLRYTITDRTQLGAERTAQRAALLACVAHWAALGVDFIQLREKDLAAAELLALARDVRTVLDAHRSPIRLLLNAPPEQAPAAAAYIDGLHLTARRTLPAADARRLLAQSPALAQRTSRPPLLSISCHTLEEVQTATRDGVDLILFGPIFGKSIPIPGTPSPAYRTVTPAIGLDALRAACTLAGQIPVLALGGITPDNTALCLDAGAAGIAGIRLFQQPAMAAKAKAEAIPSPTSRP
jgi:thiamine-phosphate pyrophosphorylase